MQAEEIFHSAVELPVEEREAYVAQRCDGVATMHARVLRLLAAHDSSADFMATAVLSPENRRAFTGLKTAMAEECLGPYRLISQIGEGGFGVVWLAERLLVKAGRKLLRARLKKSDCVVCTVMLPTLSERPHESAC